MGDAQDDERTANTQPAAKKPYHTPVLRNYGDIAAITKSIGSTSNVSDGGKGKFSRTS